MLMQSGCESPCDHGDIVSVCLVDDFFLQLCIMQVARENHQCGKYIVGNELIDAADDCNYEADTSERFV